MPLSNTIDLTHSVEIGVAEVYHVPQPAELGNAEEYGTTQLVEGGIADLYRITWH